MKNVLLFLCMFAFVYVAQAQSGFANPQEMEELKKMLSLDDEQVAYLQKIEAGHKHSLSETVANTEGEARNKAIKELMAQKEQQIREVLTPAQLEKYGAYIEKKKLERREKASMELKQAREESMQKEQKEPSREGGDQ